MRIIHKIIFRTCLLDTKHFTLSSHRPNYLSWASIITHDKIAYFNILDLLYRQIRHYYFLRGCFTSTTASDKDNEFLIIGVQRVINFLRLYHFNLSLIHESILIP